MKAVARKRKSVNTALLTASGMKIMKPFILGYLALGLLTGCATFGQNLSSKSILVEPGQTKEQVLGIMGAPGNRQFRGNDEAWQYCRTGLMTDDFTVIWFHREFVSGITTYNCTDAACGYVGDCSQGFRAIRWEDAPDTIIEVRSR